MFNVISKFKNRIQSFSKQPETESVGVKPESVEVRSEPQTEEKVKKVRKSRQGITNQLQIILEVMESVRRDGNSRVRAIQIVAEKRDIARATVSDKCCRLLGINAETIDKMISSPDLKELRNLLLSKWEVHRGLINNHIDTLLAFYPKDSAENLSETSDIE